MLKKIKSFFITIFSDSKKQPLSIVSLIIFLLSLLPLLYMCKYVHASGDDYGYGAWTHSAWLDTHSLVEVFKAACRTVEHYYIGWQGTWSSIFLFTLQPEVFSPNSYWIVPIIMMGLTVGGTSLLVYYLLVSKLGFSKGVFLTIDSCLLFSMLQFIPRTKSAIFWYNGTAHYIIPYFWAVISIYCFFKFIDTYKLKFWLVALFCMFMLGGASYLAALLAPIILIYLLIINGKKRRTSLLLLIPLGVEAIGLLISMKAPGNTVRGGDEIRFTVAKAIGTIGQSFYEGIITIGQYIIERPVIFIIFIFTAVIIWDALLRGEGKFKFKNPVLFIILMFCTYCAMFAPGIYAGTEVSGGVPNTIFQVFLLTASASIIYTLGWFYNYQLNRKGKRMNIPFYLDWRKFRINGIIPALILCFILVLICRSYIRDSTMGQCIEYVISGQADDYKEQMDERLAILLDDSKKDVELPQINQEQGPLMHMEVLGDPNAWTNQVACQFFRKDRIVGIERK